MYLTCPKTVLPLIPALVGQLQSETESRRLAAVGLVGRLLSIEGLQLEQGAPYLATGFLDQFRDAEVGRCHWARAQPVALQPGNFIEEQPGWACMPCVWVDSTFCDDHRCPCGLPW